MHRLTLIVQWAYQPVIEAAIEKLPEHPSRGTRQTLYMVHEVGVSSDMIRLL